MKISLDSFLAVLKRSGLIPADRLQAELEAFQTASDASSDAQLFAEHLTSRNLITPWQTEKLLQGKHKGFFLGKYRLLSLLGKGGMSSVYLAEHVLMRRRCAIKVLPAKRVNDTSYLGRFHREAQAVAALDHPNIVRAYDVDQEKDGNVEIHFLVMEYVDGLSLLDIVNREGPQSPVATAEYIRQAALGLEHAHRAGLIHRDIKPGNLLVDNSGVVKVMDLGLARFFAGQDEESLTIQYDEKVLGTADYLAPEQAVDSHDIDARADLYSLGCTAYFLLTGHPPFPQGTLPQRLMAHQSKEPAPLAEKRPDAPPRFLEIIRKMMAKKPEDRYPTAAATADALAAWLHDEGGPKWEAMRARLASSGIDPGSSSARLTSGGPQTTTPAPAPAATASPIAATPDDDNLGAFLANLSGPDSPPKQRDVAEAGRKTPPPAETSGSERQASAPRTVGSKTGGSGSSKLRRGDSSTKRRGAASRPAARPDSDITPPLDRTPEPPAHLVVPKAQTPSGRGSPAARGTADVAQEPAIAEAVLAEPVEVEGSPPTPLTASPMSDTSYRRGRGRRKASAIPRQFFIYGGVGAALLVVVISAIVLLSGDSDSPSPNPAGAGEVTGGDGAPTPRPPVAPSRPAPENPSEVTVGPDGHFATIAEAIAYGQENPPLSPGEQRVIKVTGGETYQDRIEIANWNIGLLHLQSVGDKRAVLKPTGSGPVLSLGNSSRVTIEGFRIDASEKPVGVLLSGVLNNVLLTNLEITGIREIGIDGDRASGLNSGRLELRDLRLESSRPASQGVRFTAPPSGGLAGGIEQVSFANLTFVGPFETGLRLTGSLQKVTVQRSRFHNLKTALELDWQAATIDAVSIENNTFHRAARGLVFSGAPGTVNQLTVNKNLFVGVTEAEVSLTGQPGETVAALSKSARASFNWTDRSPEAVKTNAWDLFREQGKTAVAPQFASSEPGEATFLKPQANELRVPAAPGNDKFIGALSP